MPNRIEYCLMPQHEAGSYKLDELGKEGWQFCTKGDNGNILLTRKVVATLPQYEESYLADDFVWHDHE